MATEEKYKATADFRVVVPAPNRWSKVNNVSMKVKKDRVISYGPLVEAALAANCPIEKATAASPKIDKPTTGKIDKSVSSSSSSSSSSKLKD